MLTYYVHIILILYYISYSQDKINQIFNKISCPEFDSEAKINSLLYNMYVFLKTTFFFFIIEFRRIEIVKKIAISLQFFNFI